MKCAVCGTNSGKYAVCFKHRETKYESKCPIHGKTRTQRVNLTE